MNKNKLLLILGCIAVISGCVLAAAALVLLRFDFVALSDTFFIIASLLGVASVVILVFRLYIQSKDFGMDSDNPPHVEIKIVDVKDIPKSREQELFEQYEDLYKKKLISKEDLDKKKEELLGKK